MYSRMKWREDTDPTTCGNPRSTSALSSSVCLGRPLSIGIVVQLFPNCLPVHSAFHSCVFFRVEDLCTGKVEDLGDGPENRTLESTYTRAARKNHKLANTTIVQIPLAPARKNHDFANPKTVQIPLAPWTHRVREIRDQKRLK